MLRDYQQTAHDAVVDNSSTGAAMSLDLDLLASVMEEWSDTASDHHMQAAHAIRKLIALQASQQHSGMVSVPIKIINRFPKLDMADYYSHADVCDLNEWGVELVLAAQEPSNHKHTVAILIEKWDDKTVTSAPFCIVCGASQLAAQEQQ